MLISFWRHSRSELMTTWCCCCWFWTDVAGVWVVEEGEPTRPPSLANERSDDDEAAMLSSSFIEIKLEWWWAVVVAVSLVAARSLLNSLFNWSICWFFSAISLSRPSVFNALVSSVWFDDDDDDEESLFELGSGGAGGDEVCASCLSLTIRLSFSSADWIKLLKNWKIY